MTREVVADVTDQREAAVSPEDDALFNTSAWTTALDHFARATGMAVTVFDRSGHLRIGPITPSPLSRELAKAGAWLRGGHCLATDVDAAVLSMRQDALVRKRGFGVLPVVAVPLHLPHEPIGAVVAGWVFDAFPDPISADRLSKILGIPFTPLWQVVRQQPPVSEEKLLVYVELLRTLSEAVIRERSEILQEQRHTTELRVLNDAGRRLAIAESVADVAGIVVEAVQGLCGPVACCIRVIDDAGEHLVGETTARSAPVAAQPAALDGVVDSLRIPVTHAGGGAVAELEVAGTPVVRRHVQALVGLASQAAIALQKTKVLSELRERSVSLERANRARDAFLAVVSHELRTPLTPILGWANMLRQRHDATDPGTTRALEAIERNAQQELRIVDDMLDLSRILNDKVHLTLEALPISEIIRHVVAKAHELARQGGLRIAVDAAPDLPPVYGDIKRLHQVFDNLVSNAVKFTPAGGTITIETRRASDSTVVFAVSDTGVGIDPAVLPHIFDRFEQGDSTYARQHGGLGIGLSIVRGIVQLHGGRVWAESSGPGTGARFVLELPVAHQVQPRNVEASTHARPAHGAGVSNSHRTVLLVDDAADCLDVIEAMVTRWGYATVRASSAREAYAVARSTRPDIIVTDIGMPGQDGFRLLRLLRDDETLSSVPVIAVTGYAMDAQREEVMNAGFAAHVPKPVEAEALESELRRLLEA